MSTIITPGLTFDRDAHAYRLDGEIVPGVTGVIKHHLPVDTSFYTSEARDRGSAVHTAIEYHLDGDLDEDSVTEPVRSYFDGYLRFMRELVTLPVCCEVGLAHRRLRYAGTLDLFCFMRWGGKEVLALVDFKTGQWQPWHDLQLAAYRELLDDNGGALGLKRGDRPEMFIVCQLKADGTYRIQQPKTLVSTAWALFASCLNLSHFTRSYTHGHSDDYAIAAA